MSGVEESKGGATESKESSGSAIAAEWGGMPIKAEDSVVLCPKNEMGYPPLVYFDDIDEFLGSCGVPYDGVIAQITQMLNKYRVLERSIIPKAAGLREKIPEQEKTLEMIQFLKKKHDDEESFKTHFNLSDNVFAKAEAKTMLEYTHDEAIALLTKNHAEAKESLTDLTQRLEFIRSQINTAEVLLRRLYNWDVIRRRKEREAAAAAKSS